MKNFRRTVFTTFIFLALLAPFAAGWLHWLQSANAASELSSTTSPASELTQMVDLAQTTTLAPPAAAAPNAARTVDAPIFLVSDSKTLWLVRPFLFESKMSVELLQRPSNSPTWTSARVSGNKAIPGIPQHVGVVPPGRDSGAKANAFIVFGESNFNTYTLSERNGVDPLPLRNRVTAAVGASSGIFAIATGPFVGGTPPVEAPKAPEPRPAAPVATSTQAAPVKAPVQFAYNAYWYHDGRWQTLPAMARLNEPDSAHLAPLEGARVVLAHQPHRLMALWVNPLEPATLHARSLVYTAKDAQWSAPVVSPLPSSLPRESRLSVVTLDQTIFLAWPEPASPANGAASPDAAARLQIRMARLASPGLPNELTVAPESSVLPLGDASKDVSLANGVAVAPSENSVAVVLTGKNGDLVGMTLDQHGKVLIDPSPIESTSPKRPVPLLQNIALLILVALLALSLWQWRQRPMKPAIPQGMQVARVYQRLFAFLIDIGLPLIAVAIAFGINDMDGFQRMLTTWIEGFGNVEAFAKSPEVLYVVGAYIAHVTVCELMFGKSLGKYLLGTQVIMLDGKAPTVLAVLLRNLVRIPELLSIILLLYMLLSENRQRLGDLIARTLVVSPKSNVTESE